MSFGGFTVLKFVFILRVKTQFEYPEDGGSSVTYIFLALSCCLEELSEVKCCLPKTRKFTPKLIQEESVLLPHTA